MPNTPLTVIEDFMGCPVCILKASAGREVPGHWNYQMGLALGAKAIVNFPEYLASLTETDKSDLRDYLATLLNTPGSVNVRILASLLLERLE